VWPTWSVARQPRADEREPPTPEEASRKDRARSPPALCADLALRRQQRELVAVNHALEPVVAITQLGAETITLRVCGIPLTPPRR
jgi:hypothetical protein